MDENTSEMKAMYEATITDGQSLLQELDKEQFSNITGISKLQRKIKKDILFLLETLQSNKLKKEHLVCSNLHFYKALVQEIRSQPECEAVLEPFLYKTCDGCHKLLVVDVVSCKGQRWTKVVARNPLALHQIYKEGDNFGRRSIMDQTTSYMQAATQNLHLYCSPQLTFSFVNGVPEKMKYFLEKFSIAVKGEVIHFENPTANVSSGSSDEDDCADYNCDTHMLVPVKQRNLTRLNLCVTTLIAYVSSLTNGGCNYKFSEPLLNQQAEWERIHPVKLFLDHLFKDKELICCSAAIEDFRNIIDMVGGEEEKHRAAVLLSGITIVPDVCFSELKPSGKIKKRSLVIFGTGHVHEAITVTANKGFVLASKQKGVNFAVIIHESRALTERKQVTEVDFKVFE